MSTAHLVMAIFEGAAFVALIAVLVWAIRSK